MSRFSFDQDGEDLLPGIDGATPVEIIGRMLRRVDRAKIRRRSADMGAPEFRLDGNEIVRIMMKAFDVEKKSYQHREKGAHRGDLGALSIELLKVLIGFGRKHRSEIRHQASPIETDQNAAGRAEGAG